MALLEAQVQSRPLYHFASSYKILFLLGQMMAMLPLILYNYLTASGHITEKKLCCFTSPRENMAIVVILSKGSIPGCQAVTRFPCYWEDSSCKWQA